MLLCRVPHRQGRRGRGRVGVRAGPLSTRRGAPKPPGLPVRFAESESEVGILMRGLGLQNSFHCTRDSHD